MYFSFDKGARLPGSRIRRQCILKVSTLPHARHRVPGLCFIDVEVLTAILRREKPDRADFAIETAVCIPPRSIELDIIHRHMCIAAKAICAAHGEHQAVHRDTGDVRRRLSQIELIGCKVIKAAHANIGCVNNKRIPILSILCAKNIHI